MAFRISFFFLGAILLLEPAWAQREDLLRRQQRMLLEDHVENPLRFFMTTRWTSGIDYQISNMGQVNFQAFDDRGPNSLTFRFDDGFITIDPVGSDLSSSFGFQYDNATVNADGFVDSFTLTRYASESTGLSEDFGQSMDFGVEMGLQYFLINRRNFKLGVVGSVGVNEVNVDSSQTVQGDLYRQMATVLMPNSLITPIPGEAFTSRDRGPVIDLPNQLIFDPDSRQRVQQNIPGEGVRGVPSIVNGSYSINGVTTGFRLGGITEWNTGRFWLQAGAGLASVYTYSNFRVRQAISNPQLFQTVDMLGSSQQSNWGYGPYAEIRGGFRINRHARIFIGGIFMNVDETFSQTVDGVTSSIRMESPVVFEFGVNIDF